MRTAVPVVAGRAEKIGDGLPGRAGAVGAEAVQLVGGADLGEDAAQVAVVEFGADADLTDPASASQHRGSWR